MHGLMVFMSGVIALGLRQIKRTENAPLSWSKTLISFVFPPLLLLMTASAIILMGYQGEMLGLEVGLVTYISAIAFLVWSLGLLIYRFYQAQNSLGKLQTLSLESISEQPARILDLAIPYSAQIGFWQPQLVMSQGLIDLLDQEHLETVLAHEQAHYYYRDTFWFFWLGWLRQITAWLPQNDELWQELLFLRELRADQKACEKIDPLLLAESLHLVAQQNQQTPLLLGFDSICAAFQSERFTLRINGLLEPTTQNCLTSTAWVKLFWLLALIPLIFIPLHS